MHKLIFYGRPVVVRCMGVRFGMGWVGSWVDKFTWQWVGLVWVDENRPMDNSVLPHRGLIGESIARYLVG